MLLDSWVDGRPGAALPVDDRGLAYGDGLYETIRVAAGRSPLVELHMQRLLRGADVLQMPVDIDAIEAELRAFMAAQLAAGRGDCTVKLLLTRGSAGRGYRPLPEAQPRRLLLAFPPAAWPAANTVDGIALYECALRLSINPTLAGIKHLNRLEQVLARGEWDDDRHAEGLLCDVEGRVIEGTMSNLFLVHDGVLVTPRLHRCGVGGVMRGFLIARALALGIPVSERDVVRADLDAADELFICNSNIGAWPVRELAARRFVPGPVTRRMQAEVDILWKR